MRAVVFIVLCLSVLGFCRAGLPDHSYEYKLKNSDIQEILDIHNDDRRTVRATNMRHVKWNPRLAKVAGNWSLHCAFAHRPARSVVVDNVTLLGENIHVSAYIYRLKWSYMIGAWFREGRCFDYDTSHCLGDCYECTHYTQMMRYNSYEVGCGLSHCKGIKKFSPYWSWNFVCNYIQFGNWVVGGVLEKPYTEAASEAELCSDCPVDQSHCDQGLCRACDKNWCPITAPLPTNSTTSAVTSSSSSSATEAQSSIMTSAWTNSTVSAATQPPLPPTTTISASKTNKLAHLVFFCSLIRVLTAARIL